MAGKSSKVNSKGKNLDIMSSVLPIDTRAFDTSDSAVHGGNGPSEGTWIDCAASYGGAASLPVGGGPGCRMVWGQPTRSDAQALGGKKTPVIYSSGGFQAKVQCWHNPGATAFAVGGLLTLVLTSGSGGGEVNHMTDDAHARLVITPAASGAQWIVGYVVALPASGADPADGAAESIECYFYDSPLRQTAP